MISLHKHSTIHVISFALIFMVTFTMMGCGQQSQTEQVTAPQIESENKTKVAAVKPALVESLVSSSESPRIADNLPFAKAYKSIMAKGQDDFWVYLWEKAPELVVEKWLSEKPDTEGKYVLIEFWATWCPPCKKAIPKLNKIHQKFKEKLTIIAITDETEEDVLTFKEPKIEYAIAIDTQKRLFEKYNIRGIPCAVIIEPGGYVVWEGFGLSEDIVEKILTVGNKVES